MYMYSLAGQATAVIRPVEGAKRIKQPILTDPVGITVHN